MARHDERDEEDAARVLAQLEFARTRLEERFETRPGELEVVLHSSTAQLDAAQPWLPLARRLTAPAARRYVVGWAGPRELHVLCPRLLAHRASNVEGSLEMLMLAPSRAARAPLRRRRATRRCRRRSRPRRLARWSRWAWLVEGAAQWLSGQTRHVRPAVARRLREGSAPAFPPSRADALLLGGSIFDLLAREEGDRACVTLARGPHPDGPLRALEIAFPRSVRHTESAWRSHLARLGASRPRSKNGDGDARPRTPRARPATSVTRQRADPRRVRAPAGSRRGVARGRRGARARRRAPEDGDEDVARAGGEEVGHVEAAGAARERRDALLEQQALDELRLGLVARPGGAHERALGVARADLAGADRELGLRRGLRAVAGVHERQPAVVAEALVGRVRAPRTTGTRAAPVTPSPGARPARRRCRRSTTAAGRPPGP